MNGPGRLDLEQLLQHGPCRFGELSDGTRHSPATLFRCLNQLSVDGLVFLDSNRRYGLREAEALRLRLTSFRTRFPNLLSDAATEIFE